MAVDEHRKVELIRSGRQVIWVGGSIAGSRCFRFRLSSRERARRYTKREADPLPFFYIGRGDGERVVADPAEIDAWAKREYQPHHDVTQ